MARRSNTSSGSPRLLRRPDRAVDEFPETVLQSPGSFRTSGPWTHHPPGRCCPDTISPRQHKSTALLRLPAPFPGRQVVTQQTSAHIRSLPLFFYCINSSCISICFVLSFPVFSLIPFEFFDPTFLYPDRSLGGAPWRCPHAFLPRRFCQIRHFPSPLFPITCALFAQTGILKFPLTPFLSMHCALLRKQWTGVHPSAIFNFRPAIVFKHLQSAALASSTSTTLVIDLRGVVSFYFFLFLFTSLRGSLSPATFASIFIEESSS